MDLFDYMRENNMEKEAPLARPCPTTLDEVVGQHIGKDKLLYRAIQADKISSIIFMGRRERGKRHWQRLLPIRRARSLPRSMPQFPGKRTWRKWWRRPKTPRGCMGKTILFIDEIHRFNKGQQDYLLPFVEDALSSLSAQPRKSLFEVNGALISRSIILN